jgi:thiamine biosynthesis lipoprotein
MAALPVAQWSVWSTTARLVVTEPAALPAAGELLAGLTARVDAACSRFRTDSELSALPADGRPTRVSPLLAELVEVSLLAAARTGGDVDPTLGAALVAAGYDRDISELDDRGAIPFLAASEPAWLRVRVDGRTLTVPAGVRLDLGATAKAWTADRAAAEITASCGTGALVALGGDIATAGPAPDGGWQVAVCDGPGEPRADVALAAGGALATSSTTSRTWRRAGRPAHHVLDPRTGAPADPVWRTVSAVAGSCVEANTLTTAALVQGIDALPWLRSLGAPARLVGRTGKVVTLGGWPGVPG